MSSFSLPCLSFSVTVRKSVGLCFEIANYACSPTFLFGLCVGIMFCLGILIMLCASIVFCLRCRAGVAPPVNEAEDEGSFQDEFYPQSCQLGVGVEIELEVDLV